MAGQVAPAHPVLSGHGWWTRPIRHLHPVHGESRTHATAGRALLISGASGTLGRAFARLCHLRGLACHLLSRQDVDIADPRAVASAIRRWRPWAWVNASGYVDIDRAEDDPRQWRENVLGPAHLAQACATSGVALVTFSSDMVFDGLQHRPCVEGDPCRPVNAYGRAKAEAERQVLAADASALVIRSAAFFGPWDSHNFLTRGLDALRAGTPWLAVADEIVSPTNVCDLVHRALDLLIDGERGIWHLANQGEASWHGFAVMAAEAAGLDASLVRPVAAAGLGRRAPRPARVVLDSARGRLMPPLREAIARYLAERAPDVLPDLERGSWGDHEDSRVA